MSAVLVKGDRICKQALCQGAVMTTECVAISMLIRMDLILCRAVLKFRLDDLLGRPGWSQTGRKSDEKSVSSYVSSLWIVRRCLVFKPTRSC